MLNDYMKTLPLIAILRGITPAEALPVAETLLEVGIVMMEVPLNSPDACASIQLLAKNYANKALIGAGTVLSATEVSAVHQAGAQLVVSPNTNPAVIAATKRLNMVSMPGSLTPSELLTALATGADAAKLFPAELLPPAAVKAVRAVLPAQFPLCAVGGINSANMKEYVRHGTNGFGIGSALYKPGKSLAELSAAAATLVAACRDSLTA